jgi:periplasmic divalent cation tolerance protein
MTDKVVAFVTCENAEQAGRIAEALVGEKLAACVNVVGQVRSCYAWEGKLTWSEEVMLIIKTTLGRFGQLQKRVRELHSYETPEIVCVSIEDGFEKYMDWIDASVS